MISYFRRHTIEYKMTRTITLLEEIWRAAHNSQLTEEFFNAIEKKTGEIGKVYNITPTQCVITALLLNFEVMNLAEMGEHVNLTRISLLQYDDSFNDLIKRRMATKEETCYRGKKTTVYKLTAKYEKALRQGKPIAIKPYQEYSIRDLCNEFQEIKNMCKSLCDEDMEEQFFNDFHSVVQATKHLPTVIGIEELGLEQTEWLFVWATIFENIKSSGNIDADDFEEVVGEDCANQFFCSLSRGATTLQQMGYIENCVVNQGYAESSAYRLSIKGYEELLPDLKSPQLTKIQALTKKLKKPQEIEYKELFFNADEQKQIEKLTALLQPDNYNSVVERMEEEGLRTGFCILFYGGPGTGKTELCLQLARQTNRGIFQIDLASVRDKYVGETEKIIKSYFNIYKKLVKAQRKIGELEPILFINEADGILNRRHSQAIDAVDKMENAMQNIILQELETLDGILVATTNLTSNLDDAFERRFLFKMEFSKPDVATRAKIIGSMLPELFPKDAHTLAEMYELSGGQLENVKRKAQVDYILSGDEPTLASVSALCEQENLKKQTNKKIGFC